MKNVSHFHKFIEQHIHAMGLGALGIYIGGYIGITYAAMTSAVIANRYRLLSKL